MAVIDTMKKELIIIGAGSVGGHVASNLEDYSSEFHLVGFLDDNTSKIGTDFVGFPVLGAINSISNYPTTISVIVGIAFPIAKYKVVKKLKDLGYTNFPSLISRHAWLSKNVEIGEGCLFYPGTAINYNCSIRDFVVMNMNCAIGHDCIIESYASLAPGVLIGGNTSIDQFTEMGIGSKTIQGIKIGQKATIGAGSVIIRNIQDAVVVVGNPGRIIKYN